MRVKEMENEMKKVLIIALLMLWSMMAAAGTQYLMRVDGLACPFCAYGIEKKLKSIDGVEEVDVDLQKGEVTVNTRDDIELTETAMTKLFKEAGFTYRSMTRQPR
jgi:mercuric ion binding protein